MKALWLPSRDVMCVHPGDEPIVGHSAVSKSWKSLFSAGGRRFPGSVISVSTVNRGKTHIYYIYCYPKSRCTFTQYILLVARRAQCMCWKCETSTECLCDSRVFSEDRVVELGRVFTPAGWCRYRVVSVRQTASGEGCGRIVILCCAEFPKSRTLL